MIKDSIYRISGILILSSVLLFSCSKNKGNSSSDFPADFNKWSDTKKVAYMMKQTTPDSVARFMIYAALGEVKGVTLDSLGIVTNYVYAEYDTENQIRYGEAYDTIVDGLSLAQKMKLYTVAGVDNAQGLGYELGLSYLTNVREKNMSAEDVRKELEEFKKACGQDSDMYRRFTIGFRTALQYDGGKDIDPDVYKTFSNIIE